MKKLENQYLYLVVLGGRAEKANIELHDVRWVVGSEIEETYETLRNGWFGSLKGLHIDSYKRIKYVDGYRINLLNLVEDKIEKKTISKQNKGKKNLWFINLGGYDPSSMQEKHEFGMVVASTASEAKNLAKSKWLNGYKRKHKDDISSLKYLTNLDDCSPIKKVGSFEIELTLVKNYVDDNNYPDWYGYKRIDKL